MTKGLSQPSSGWRGAGGTAVLGVVLILVAGLVDAAALYVPGLALLLLSIGSVLWVRSAARGVRVTRELGGLRVVEGEPLRVEIEIRSGPITPPSGELHDPLLAQPAPLQPGRRISRVAISARFARRGLRRLDPPHVVVRDPLGLASAPVRTVGEADEVLVLPRIEPVLTPGMGGDGGSAGSRRPILAALTDFDGLRPHRPGAAASRIAWLVYARSGELHDRVLRADADSRPLVVLDLRGSAAEDDLDAAVRAAASLCVHLARLGGCALLLPGERRARVIDQALRGWPAVHARLALADSDQTPSQNAVAARSGALIWVSARSLGGPPRGLVRAYGDRLIVVPGTLPGKQPRFTVAGCAGYAVGREAAQRRSPTRGGAAV